MDTINTNTSVPVDDELFYYSTNVRRRVKKERAHQRRVQSLSMENVGSQHQDTEVHNSTQDCISLGRRAVVMRRDSIHQRGRRPSVAEGVGTPRERPVSMNELTTNKLLHTICTPGGVSDLEDDVVCTGIRMADITLGPPDGFTDPVLSRANSVETTSDLGVSLLN